MTIIRIWQGIKEAFEPSAAKRDSASYWVKEVL
jgi:hypothetical protein